MWRRRRLSITCLAGNISEKVFRVERRNLCITVCIAMHWEAFFHVLHVGVDMRRRGGEIGVMHYACRALVGPCYLFRMTSAILGRVASIRFQPTSGEEASRVEEANYSGSCGRKGDRWRGKTSIIDLAIAVGVGRVGSCCASERAR